MSVALDPYLSPTRFSDSLSRDVRTAARNIARPGEEDRDAAVRVFYWVRDCIKYELGLRGDSASETLMRGSGSCSNKANLAVSLLRSLGVPAGFHVMEVKAKDYLGCFCTQRFQRFISRRSIHSYCSVYLGGNWVRFDPSDDIRLSYATQHLARQTIPVEFNGREDARLNLDPDHVVRDPDDVLPDIDAYLSRTPKAPECAVRVMNGYIDFLRQNCIRHGSPEESEREYFEWLARNDTCLHSEFLQLEEAMLGEER